MKNENGFTLIEMMVVMLIISVLLIITIPNVTKHNSSINNKGCKAFVKMVQAQVQSYEIENHEVPTLNDLIESKYLIEGTCPDGTNVIIDSEGNVTSDTTVAATP